jgi:EmrB/QacA subfamily drug resistance transporter
MTFETKNQRWWILAILSLSVFLVVVDNTIVNVALPTFSKHLHASNTSLQWIVDGYSLPFAGLLLAGGGLSDRLGRRRVMQFGLVGFGLFSAYAAWSTSTGELLSARALMGVAAAFIFPPSLSILTVTFVDPAERAKAFGIWGAVSGMAIAFGPLVGGALLTHFWYGSIFLVNIPIVLVTLLGGWLIVPESKSPLRRNVDLGGLLLGTLGITALVLAIIEGPTWGWLSTRTLVLFAASLVFLVSFCLFELRRRHPLLDVRVFKNRAFSSGAGAVATAFFCLFGFIFLVTQYFQLVRGYSALSAGVHTLPFAITTAIISPLGAFLALRIGARVVVAGGLAIMGIALWWQGTQAINTAYFGPIILSMIVLAFGFSLINAPSTAAVMSSLSPEQIGAGAAVNNTTRELGGTMGVAIVGSVFTSIFGPQIVNAFRGVPLTPAQLGVAKSSTQAALGTVHALPNSMHASLTHAVNLSFMTGYHRGCFAAAIVAGAAAIIIFATFPRHTTELPDDVEFATNATLS